MEGGLDGGGLWVGVAGAIVDWGVLEPEGKWRKEDILRQGCWQGVVDRVLEEGWDRRIMKKRIFLG